MSSVCYNCDTHLMNWQEEYECPFCGCKNLTEEEARDYRIGDLEIKVKSLEKMVQELYHFLNRFRPLG